MDNQSKFCTVCEGDTANLKCSVCSIEFMTGDEAEDHGCAEGSVQCKCIECDEAELNCVCAS